MDHCPTPDRTRTTGRVGPTTIDRRSLIRFGAAGFGALTIGGMATGALASGCASDGESGSTAVSRDKYQLQPLFPQDISFLAAGTLSRMPFTLIDGEGVPLTKIDAPLTFELSLEGQKVGDPVEVQVHDDGVPRAYLPLYATLPTPGIYDITTTYNGTELESHVQVYPADKVMQPLVGSVLPPAPTATRDQTLDVDPICTLSPECPFHTVNLENAIGTGKPVVVLLASPAYCRTSACGPILDLLVEQVGGRDDLIVIHSEVYKNPKTVPDLADATLAPLPIAYDMLWEPSLFVTNAANLLVARGDIVVDRVEMNQMLALAV